MHSQPRGPVQFTSFAYGRRIAVCAATALALSACDKRPHDPPTPTVQPVGSATALVGATTADTSVPDAATVLAPAVVPKVEAPADRSNSSMSRTQESTAMPMAGQNNDHSAPLMPAKRASGA